MSSFSCEFSSRFDFLLCSVNSQQRRVLKRKCIFCRSLFLSGDFSFNNFYRETKLFFPYLRLGVRNQAEILFPSFLLFSDSALLFRKKCRRIVERIKNLLSDTCKFTKVVRDKNKELNVIVNQEKGLKMFLKFSYI